MSKVEADNVPGPIAAAHPDPRAAVVTDPWGQAVAWILEARLELQESLSFSFDALGGVSEVYDVEEEEG